MKRNVFVFIFGLILSTSLLFIDVTKQNTIPVGGPSHINKEKIDKIKIKKVEDDISLGRSSIDESKDFLNDKELEEVKSDEIVKRSRNGWYSDGKGLIVQIVKVEKIQGGVQVFAKAWKNGKQIGFGKDGTVEIERFRIFNPPVLVPDPNGSIVRISPAVYRGGELLFATTTNTYKEDPVEAIKQEVVNAIRISGKKGTNIIKGKIGNTTSVFRPASGTGGDSIDAWYETDNTCRSWASTRAITTSSWNPYNQTLGSVGWRYRSNCANFVFLDRSRTSFPTSAIGSDTIDSATLSLYGATIYNSSNDVDINIYGSTGVPSTNSVASTDFDEFGATAFSTAISYSAWLTSTTPNDFIFNASGLAYINKTGATDLFQMSATNDHDGTTPGSVNGDNYLRWHSADEVGITTDPKLTVLHSSGGGGGTPSTKTPEFLLISMLK